MRRLDIQDRKKLRNPARHLRALKRWSENVSVWLPSPKRLAAAESHYSFKLPVFQKLTSPRHTKPEWQHECLTRMMHAALSIRRIYRADRPYRIACMIETPDIFWSEITMFFDDQYFNTFVPPSEAAKATVGATTVETRPPDHSLLDRFGLVVPGGLDYRGGYRQIITDSGDPDLIHDTHRWLICETEFR